MFTEIEVIPHMTKIGLYGIFPVPSIDKTEALIETTNLDFANELVKRWNSQPDLYRACKKAKEEILEYLNEKFIQIPPEYYPHYLDKAIAKAERSG